MRPATVPLVASLLLACSSAAPDVTISRLPGVDSGTAADGSVTVVATPDAGVAEPDAGGEAGGGDAGSETGASTACAWGGAAGGCMTVSACAALANHTSFSGQCPGPATIECCITTPNPADNPPTPVGYKLMQQSQVTPDMTAWAIAILNDPVSYPMFSTTTKTFGTLTVLARVEWHPPDFQNSGVHRGVTLYVPG